MKKQTKTLVILLVAVVIVVIAYFAVTSWNKSKEQSEAEAAQAAEITLAKLTEVNEISFEYSSETLSFTKTDGELWEYAADTTFPLDDTALLNIESILSDLKAVRSFENEDGLEAYGLQEPSMYLSASTSSGESFTLNIGSSYGSDGNYYAQVQGDSLIYTVSPDVVTAISYSLNDMAELETFDSVTEASLTSITLTSPDSSITLSKTTGENEDGETLYRWAAESSDKSEDIPPESTELQNIIYELGNLAYSSLYDYSVTEDVLTSCGLDNPAYTITAVYDDTEMTLYLSPSGQPSYYYATTVGSENIYLMSEIQVETLINTNMDSLLATDE